jgi:hypothetical protein
VGGIYYQKGFFDFTRDEVSGPIDNPDEDPNDPSDDYFKANRRFKSTVGNLVLRLGILF